MIYFDSRDERYRSPFGAVSAGTAVRFCICLPRQLGCQGAKLVVDSEALITAEYPMGWREQEGPDREWWEISFTPKTPAIYFYHFRLDTREGVRYLCRAAGDKSGVAVLSHQLIDSYQLTCYAADFTTPDWLVGGIMYQIFPDRFAYSGKPKPNVPGDRILRHDWGGQPVWEPDAQGRVRNNDYFMGDLKGIEQHLDRLEELQVTCLYLNPIFEAHSNHRYDTADYETIDPLLGDEEDFASLCHAARQRGIRIILDGVFSHTGADSKYFNKERRYPTTGAYNSPASPYYSWYRFEHWPDRYAGWWNFDTLPEVDEMNESYLAYITGPGGIAQYWLAAGASGWRLDVADELPDGFLEKLRQAVKSENPDAVIIGEVWEDASNKLSYGHLRRYLLGGQLDSVMNYPFRCSILDFITLGGSDRFFHTVMDILENYPPQVVRILMNIIGTHDTERAITALAGEYSAGRGRRWQASQRLSPEQYRLGVKRMKLASVLQYCLPGVPCIYYGDEAGMEGYRDPFCRGCYPWGQENQELLDWYRQLGRLRRSSPALREGTLIRCPAPEGVVAFERRDGQAVLLCAVNRDETEHTMALPDHWQGHSVQLGEGMIRQNLLILPPYSCAVLTGNL